MESQLMVQAFPEEQKRRQHIIDNQIYGFATSGIAATLVRRQLYDDPALVKSIYFTTAKDIVKEIQGAFSNMKFEIWRYGYNHTIVLRCKQADEQRRKRDDTARAEVDCARRFMLRSPLKRWRKCLLSRMVSKLRFLMSRHRDRGDAALLLCFSAFCLELLFSLLPDIIMVA